MSDFQPTYPAQTPAVEDFSRGPTVDVAEPQPPPYSDEKANQYQPQPQPQWGTPEFVPGTPYAAPVNVIQNITTVQNYMVWSVLNTIFCCLCFGLVACYFSSETDNAVLRGDLLGALNASRNARTMNIISTVLGAIITINYILYFARLY